MLNGFLQYITFESHQAIKHVHYKLNKITPSNITHLLNTLSTTLKIQKNSTSIHRKNPTAVRQRYAQRCGSENEHSVVTTGVLTVLR